MNIALFLFFYHVANTEPLIGVVATLVGQWVVVVVPAVFIAAASFRRERRIRTFLVALLSGCVGAFMTMAVAFLYPTPRPFLALPDLVSPLFTVINPLGSFPSGHTAFLVGISVSLFLSRRTTDAALSLFAAVLTGVARVAAGVHFPIDILGGALLGVASAIIVVFAEVSLDRLKQKKY